MIDKHTVCFLDMDGVLVNFVGGALQVHGKPDLYETTPAALGQFYLEQFLSSPGVSQAQGVGLTQEEFWRPIDNYQFWRGLEKMPDADSIVQSVFCRFTLEQVAILTSPSKAPECITAKREWMEEHYPLLAGRMIFTGLKHLLASPRHLLIDDFDRNVNGFIKAGGEALLVPRKWNRDHALLVSEYSAIAWVDKRLGFMAG